MTELNIHDSLRLSLEAKIEILKMTHRAKASHVGSALSVVDVLSVLYSGIANIKPESFERSDRDIVILSKGHAASALYAVLALRGYFPKSWLDSYCNDDAPLGGHVTFRGVPGVELSTGSLGHGMPYGTGIALSRKRSGAQGRVFVILSDGECDEGTTWESAMIANHFELNNLTVVIDRNHIQSLAYTEQTLKLEPFAEKWKAFGWNVLQIDGHNHEELSQALSRSDGPFCVIANTVKGKGISFMEDKVLWHYKSPNNEELDSALTELGIK